MTLTTRQRRQKKRAATRDHLLLRDRAPSPKKKAAKATKTRKKKPPAPPAEPTVAQRADGRDDDSQTTVDIDGDEVDGDVVSAQGDLEGGEERSDEDEYARLVCTACNMQLMKMTLAV
jgi:hypothetical protein